MSGFRKPGPLGLYDDRINIDDGTMCRAQSHTPGPLGSLNLPMHRDPLDRDAEAQATLRSK